LLKNKNYFFNLLFKISILAKVSFSLLSSFSNTFLGAFSTKRLLLSLD